jgi:rhamnose transport system substrate-binding protein
MSLVATAWSEDDTETAFKNAENLIMAHPDIDAIIGIGGSEPHSAAAAVEEAVEQGIIKKDQVFITGLTLPDFIRKHIKNGTVKFAYVTEPSFLAYTAVHVANQLTQGKTFKAGDIIEVEGLPGIKATFNEDKTVYFGLVKLDADNVDNYSW